MTRLFSLFMLLIAPLAYAQGETPLTAAAKDTLLAPQDGEIVYGDPSAPVELIEYASLSCPACGRFHNVILPGLKPLIEDGILVVRYRLYPHNGPAFYASLLVNCVDESQKEKFTEVLFELQDRWAFTSDYEGQLQKLALVGGVSAAQFDTCMSSEASSNDILSRQQAARDGLGITSIPSFFLQKEPLNVDLEIASFFAVVQAAANVVTGNE